MRRLIPKRSLWLWSCFLLWHVGTFLSIHPDIGFGGAALVGVMLLPGDFIAARLPMVRDCLFAFCLVLVVINALTWYFGFRFAVWLPRAIHHAKVGFYGFFIDHKTRSPYTEHVRAKMFCSHQ